MRNPVHLLIPVYVHDVVNTHEYRGLACDPNWTTNEGATPHIALVTCVPCKAWLRDPDHKTLALAFEAKVMAKA
jgi:hypothetical protein